MTRVLPQLLPLAFVAFLYGTRARTLARAGRPAPVWRQVCFYSGLVVMLAALVGPLDSLSQELLVAHMGEHLLLGDVATLLLVLGLTGPLLQPILRIRAFDRLRVLTNPAIALPLWVADLYLWHTPVLYQAALHHDLVHAVQHGCFIFFGANMWMPLFGPLPKPAWFGTVGKLGYIIAVRLAGAVLGNVLIWSGTVFYPAYAAGEAARGIAPLRDQGAAGVLMMVEGSLLTLGLFAWLFLDAAGKADRKQELLDWAAQRGYALSEERAARAVAADRVDELRRRLSEDRPDDHDDGHDRADDRDHIEQEPKSLSL
ncbi:MAG TPA: cytochrome c oxidase assembly protein [Solirubrobacteraceae bacterium]|nr:cytochrome c oxidase assembly protein [Solirubrobacteraceae bacterium]